MRISREHTYSRCFTRRFHILLERRKLFFPAAGKYFTILVLQDFTSTQNTVRSEVSLSV